MHNVLYYLFVKKYVFVLFVKVDTPADWDEASGLIYNPEHRSWKERPQEVMFAHGGFVPSAVPFSPKVYGKKVQIIVQSCIMIAINCSHMDFALVGGGMYFIYFIKCSRILC